MFYDDDNDIKQFEDSLSRAIEVAYERYRDRHCNELYVRAVGDDSRMGMIVSSIALALCGHPTHAISIKGGTIYHLLFCGEDIMWQWDIELTREISDFLARFLEN